MKGKMATSVFTLLLLSVCCVGSTVAGVEAPVGAGKVNEKNVTTSSDTNNTETDIQPPPMVQQLDAKLKDLKARLGNVKKENLATASDTSSSETDIQPLPLVKQLNAELSVRKQKLIEADFMQTLHKRNGDVVDFLTCEIESLQQLKDMAAKQYCLNGRKVPRDCQDAYTAGLRRSGVYTVSPDGMKQFKVYCDQDVDGGGWTVFQRRMDVSKKDRENFYREWADYKLGFGNPSTEYWLGNENINMLTSNNDQKLKVELKYNRETRYATYSYFSIGNEAAKYKLTVSGYSGNAGDSLAYHNGYPFSTRDRDNDAYRSSCAQLFSGAWWYRCCYYSNLNGLYGTNSTKGVTWNSWKGSSISMLSTKMMFKTR